MLIKHLGRDDYGVVDQFSGCGGAYEGMRHVPGIRSRFAANHNGDAIRSYAANHPEGEHWLGDVQKEDAILRFPYAPLFWSSPACPHWTDAKGRRRTFDKENQLALWKTDLTEDDLKAIRSRALMEEVVTYLRHCQEVYGRPVLAGAVENVVQCRKWAHWNRWIGELRKLGYHVRVIALNSMHVQPRATLPSMQSRNRLFVGYIHESVGRLPDWDKWLRPRAYCPAHQGLIDAVQTFKKPGQDMGVYGIKTGQYVYRCPLHGCRGQIVEPAVLPASVAIDWDDLGTPIGDRPKTAKKPRGLEEATIDRVMAGITRHWMPFLTPTGGTWHTEPYTLDEPIRTVLTRENTGLVVPMEGRPGKVAAPADEPMRTQTTRRETGVAFPPFVIPMRGGGDKHQARRADTDPLHTVSAQGNHHGFVAGLEPLLVPYYGNGNAITVGRPIGTQPTRDRWSLVTAGDRPQQIDIDSVLFRMLKVPEIKRAMSIRDDYVLVPTGQREQVQLLGNAVPPPMSEVITCALVEALTGEPLDRVAA